MGEAVALMQCQLHNPSTEEFTVAHDQDKDGCGQNVGKHGPHIACLSIRFTT